MYKYIYIARTVGKILLSDKQVAVLHRIIYVLYCGHYKHDNR